MTRSERNVLLFQSRIPETGILEKPLPFAEISQRSSIKEENRRADSSITLMIKYAVRYTVVDR